MFREHDLDGARLLFDRQRGSNVLLPGRAAIRKAPRVLQIGLLTPCNLSCSFCYRDQDAPSRLTSAFLLDLLRGAADWGVLEVAFGGGEPLLFPGFPDLLHRLHDTTPLGLNFTTNGTLLSPEVLGKLHGAVGEIRVSAYPDNHYRRTFRLLEGWNFGVNWLVTPQNVGMIEPTVRDFFALGARNVLLLGYKGPDPALHLADRDLVQLQEAVLRLQPLPLRLDICWYPRLPDLPHLFSRADCGAGDDFLVITPDKAVQPCSFHHERVPFETLDDLKRIYADMRVRKPAAAVSGCTRPQFAPVETGPRGPKTDAYVWTAHSSNNSGDWTIVGEFKTPEEARKAADALRELARAHEAYIASAEGQAWLQKNDYMGNIPTPPLKQFGDAHGFAWDADGSGLWWEEDGCGAPVLTAGAVGRTVVVYHPYCMGLPEEPFTAFFRLAGGQAVGYWQYERPTVVIEAKGSNLEVIERVREYMVKVKSAEYPSAVKDPPPWGDKAIDPRIQEDEDTSTRLATGDHQVSGVGNDLKISLSFENTFAGSLAMEGWLKASGYTNIRMRVEGDLKPLDVVKKPVVPKTGLFATGGGLAERLVGADPEKIISILFEYSHVPEALAEAFKEIPPEKAAKLGQERWKKLIAEGKDVSDITVWMLRTLGKPAQGWTEAWIAQLPEGSAPLPAHQYGAFAWISALAETLAPDRAFEVALHWYQEQRVEKQAQEWLLAMSPLKNPTVLDMIEEEWEESPPSRPVTNDWAQLAAESRMSWERAKLWLEKGRPLSLIALDAMIYLKAHGLPPDFVRPRRSEFISTFNAYMSKDAAPRVVSAVGHLLSISGPVQLTKGDADPT